MVLMSVEESRRFHVDGRQNLTHQRWLEILDELQQQHDLVIWLEPENVVQPLLEAGLTNMEAELVQTLSLPRAERVEALWRLLRPRPEMANALVTALDFYANVPDLAADLSRRLRPFVLMDITRPPRSFTVDDGARFRRALRLTAATLEPLLEWCLPALSDRGCLSQEDVRRIQIAERPAEAFAECMRIKSCVDYQVVVDLLGAWMCYHVLDTLHGAYLMCAAELRSMNSAPLLSPFAVPRDGPQHRVSLILQSGPAWTLLHGMPACGKTFVARHAAEEAVRCLGFAQVVWLHVGRDGHPAEVLRFALVALHAGDDGPLGDIPPDLPSLHDRVTRLALERQEGRGERLLLVLDDLWDPAAVSLFGAFSDALVTSRERTVLRRTNLLHQEVHVEPSLTRDEADSVVRSIMGPELYRQLVTRDEAMPEELRRLLDAHHRFPASVNAVGLQLRDNADRWQHTGVAFLSDLREDQESDSAEHMARRLLSAGLAGSYEYPTALDAVAASLDRLSSEDGRRFHRCSVVRRGGAFSAAVLARQWRVTRRTAEAHLDRYHALGLLQARRYDRGFGGYEYELHPLTANALRRRAEAAVTGARGSAGQRRRRLSM